MKTKQGTNLAITVKKGFRANNEVIPEKRDLTAYRHYRTRSREVKSCFTRCAWRTVHAAVHGLMCTDGCAWVVVHGWLFIDGCI